MEETLSALSDLIHCGKVRAIGTSTFPASEIVEAQWVAERRGLERFRTEQPPYSIINRSIEREVLPICQRYGMGTLVWSPLGQGLRSTTCWPAPTSPSTTRSSAGSTRSLHPVRTPAPTTWPTHRRPSRA
jgi:aryl-alcohol dehydrogenase-like predicted oxidoreductase